MKKKFAHEYEFFDNYLQFFQEEKFMNVVLNVYFFWEKLHKCFELRFFSLRIVRQKRMYFF